MYDFEFAKVIREIKKSKAKRVLIQLPDGLKPRAKEIVDRIEKETDVFIWAGSCFGACDVPDVKDVDLVVQFGHSKWPF